MPPSPLVGAYDAEGHALVYAYSARDPTTHVWHTTTYRVDYLKQDSYLEQSTRGSSDDPTVLATTDTSLYDAFGRRIAIDTHAAGQTTDQVRAFAYDAEGEILQRRDGSATGGTFTLTDNGGYATHHYSYVAGQQVGSVDEHGSIDVLSGVTGFSKGDSGTGDYVVQAGDTLQSIAQAVYGDASLWYVLASANGFELADDAPAAGQTLKLPQVTTSGNTANTFKPYNPQAISGSTTPSLPLAPPPPSAAGCSALAEIVVVAVMVVVAYYVGPQVAAEVGHGLLGAVAGGAAAGASASAAGQLTGDTLGVSHGFDWNQVLVGAVGGAVGGGLSAELSAPNSVFGTTFTTDAEADGLNIAGNAVIGAASYASTYEAEKVTGEAAHFSWAGLVANAAGSVVAGEFGPTQAQAKSGDQSGTAWQRIEANAAEDVVRRETSVALGDHHVQSWQQVGEDAFGNALGNAAVAGIKAYQAKQAQPDRINTMSREDVASPTWTVDDLHVDLSPDGSVGDVSPVDAFSGYPAAGAQGSVTDGLPSTINGKPVTNLPQISVGLNARDNQEFMNDYWWALQNHYAPPTTTTRSGLIAYRQGAMQAWVQRAQNYYDQYKFLNATPRPNDTPATPYDVINNAIGDVVHAVTPNLYAFAEAGAPMGTWGGNTQGFLEAAGNLAINMENLGLSAMVGTKLPDFPNFSIDQNGKFGAAIFDVASLGAGGISTEVDGLRTLRAFTRGDESLNAARGFEVPSTAGGAGPTGESYSVAYQMTLDSASYPGLSRGVHFQEANESLLTAMEADPEFAQMMQNIGVDVQRTPTGLAPRTSPADWTWHHAEDPGVMQLVPRPQHAPGSIFQNALHPNGRGGYSIWGK